MNDPGEGGKKMGGRGRKRGKNSKAEAGDGREGVRKRKEGRKTGSQGKVVGDGGGRRKWVRRSKLCTGRFPLFSCLCMVISTLLQYNFHQTMLLKYLVLK